MKVVKKGAGEQYDPARHSHCWSVHKITPGQESQLLNIGLSHFLPHGGAEMSASQLERVYFLVSGSMRVKGKAEEHVLETGDLIYIGAGEEREVQVVGGEPATILVIMAKVG